MPAVDTFIEVPPVTPDDFEDGWDRGVDWANENAQYAELKAVEQLYVRRCSDVAVLARMLRQDPCHVFATSGPITQRQVEGFIDGVVAVLRQGGT